MRQLRSYWMILMTDNHGMTDNQSERCCAVGTAPLRRAPCWRNEQNFTCDAFLHCNVTLSRFLERQFLRNRDLQPAISYRFGHVQERLGVLLQRQTQRREPGKST
jgi:hypothetical protein